MPLPSRVLALAALSLALSGCGVVESFGSDGAVDSDVYVVNADGSGLANLTDDSQVDMSPAWSPDGTRIAFISDDDGYLMNADGSGRTRLAATPEFETDIAWSPDGTRLALADRNDAALYVVGADGSGLRRLVVGMAGADPPSDGPPGPPQIAACLLEPAWSPDGARLAFCAGASGYDPEIHVIGVDGSGLTRLTDLPGRVFAPAWSPNGAMIAFAHEGGDGSGIYVMNADGSDLRRLTDVQSDVVAPAWSPDSTRLLFTGLEPLDVRTYDPATGPRAEIFALNVDGSGLTQLTDNTISEYDPAWSPDGAMIGFGGISESDGSSNVYVYVMNADGSGLVQVAGTPADAYNPVWSPDWSKIAFTSE